MRTVRVRVIDERGPLDWADRDAWRRPYFNLPEEPPSLPPGFRSQSRQAWDEELVAQQQHADAEQRVQAEHVRMLGEQEQIAKWKALVDRYGVAAVEAIAQIRLPASLRQSQEPSS